MGDRRSSKIAQNDGPMLMYDLFRARSNLLTHAFVWAVYIYIGSIEVTCRSTVAKIVLTGNLRWPPSCLCKLISSPEHNVLMVSCCGQSVSVVRRQQLLYKPTPPTPLGQLTRYLVGSIGVTCRSKIAKIIQIGNPRWPPS